VDHHSRVQRRAALEAEPAQAHVLARIVSWSRLPQLPLQVMLHQALRDVFVISMTSTSKGAAAWRHGSCLG
jgi:hypothetical protein